MADLIDNELSFLSKFKMTISEINLPEADNIIKLNIGLCLRLIAGNMPASNQSSFISQALADLSKFPYHILMNVIHRARTVVTFPNQLVAWVSERCDYELVMLDQQEKSLIAFKTALLNDGR